MPILSVNGTMLIREQCLFVTRSLLEKIPVPLTIRFIYHFIKV